MSFVDFRSVTVSFSHGHQRILALDAVDLEVESGEILAVVGESGCGKTTLARTLLGLQPLDSGEIRFEGKSISGVDRATAFKMGMVWQDPNASLDPRWTAGKSASEPASLAGKSIDLPKLFSEVGLSEDFIGRYPHQMSGGQRQRVAIARALALEPPLLICDEPTAALDLSIRAQILMLLKEIQKKRGCTILYISHDLTTVRYLADRVAVMYLGRVVEIGSSDVIFDSPAHPYARALIDSAPTLDTLGEIPGAPVGETPDPAALPSGCRYSPRCAWATAECHSEQPKLQIVRNQAVACIHPLEGEAVSLLGKS